MLGNTVLDVRTVEQAVYPFLGMNKSLHDVQQARDALALAYRNAGFGTVVVDIPEQAVDAGIVRLRVTEGRLERVRVGGAQYFSERAIVQELPALKSGEVPKLNDLQTELGRIAAEAPDRQVTPVLKSGTTTGTIDIDLKVSDKLPVHGSFEVDNNNTADTSALRATGVLSYANMFQRAETLSFQYETSPDYPSEVQLSALTYSGRTSDPMLTWSAYAIRSNSDVAAVGALAVVGDGKIGGARLTLALDAGSSWSDSLSFGADYKDFTQNVHLIGAASSVTPIHYVVWSGLYAVNAQSPSLAFTGSLGVNFGIRNIDSRDSDFEYNRAGAQSNFLYLRGSDVLLYKLWRDWTAQLKLSYQYTGAPLVDNEQFAIGGAETVRGYYEAEALVDTGIAESLEFATPPLRLSSTSSVLFAFYDAAQAEIVMPLASQRSQFALGSVGAGYRGTWAPHLDASFDWAYALRRGPSTAKGDNRIKFAAKYNY